jgi:hypothetical protein
VNLFSAREGRKMTWLSCGMLLLAQICGRGGEAASFPGAIGSAGGRYFAHRLELSVPAFSQDDPRWSHQFLGPTNETLGVEGCTLTSIVMVLNFYGVKTDPLLLNEYLFANRGYNNEGYLSFADVCPYTSGKIRLAYRGWPSYAKLDESLLAGHPVIVQLPRPGGAMHFVVVVGKKGWDYLVRDPAADPHSFVSQLKDVSAQILRQYLYLPVSSIDATVGVP